MVIKRKWVDAAIPAEVAEAIDRFLQTEFAAKTGVHSRSDFLTRLCVSWFSTIDRRFSIFDPDNWHLFILRDLKKHIHYQYHSSVHLTLFIS
jgi:hypothetical protein